MTNTRRQRIENDLGHVRCRACGEFKPPEKMKWNRGRPKCTTICKRCNRERYLSGNRRGPETPEHRRERKQRALLNGAQWMITDRAANRARLRAYVQLAGNHPDEYSELYEAARAAAIEEQLLGVEIVPEHFRGVYGVRARP